MRIKTLRSLALASILIIFDFRELLYAGDDGFSLVRYQGYAGWLTIISALSCLGLVLVAACSILLMNSASSFARPVVICAAMLFIEVLHLFDLVTDEILLWALLLVYLFLKALLILFVLEATAQTCRIRGNAESAALPERIGLLYALSFPLRVGEIFFPDFRGVFWLAGLCMAILTSCVMLYMYTQIYLPPESPAEPTPLFDEEEEEESGAVPDAAENLSPPPPSSPKDR